MPHHNNWKQNRLTRTFNGLVTSNEVLLANLELFSDERFDKLEVIINDFSRVRDFKVEKLDVDLIASTDISSSLLLVKIKIAIIVQLQPLKKWVEYYSEQMENTKYQVKIFNTLDEAGQWL